MSKRWWPALFRLAFAAPRDQTCDAATMLRLVLLSVLCSCTGIVSTFTDDSGPSADPDAGLGDAGQSCDPGTHLCASTCLPDDAVTSCGSSCSPCTPPANAVATCTQGACGFTCASGFEPCLGRCLVADAGTCPVSLRANQLTKLTSGDVGTRSQAVMGYLPATNEYVLIGGARTHDPQPYDVQVLTLGDAAWRNAYPAGKETSWGPAVGNSTAPGFATERFEVKDTSGFSRPSFEAYGGMNTFSQAAWLGTTQKLQFYLWNHMFSYDAPARTWAFQAPATDPAGGPDAPRLMWGAMTADATGSKVLLFGGANVESDAGTPGTWVYEPASTSWRKVTGAEPVPRSYAALVTEPERNQALLFGGDQLDRLLADTWTFDFATEKWTQHSPPLSPSPRAGHRLLYLPQAKATVLLGGWTHSSTTDYVSDPYARLPWEVWRFDFATHSWVLIKHFTETTPDFGPSVTNGSFTFAAAVGVDDVAVLHYKGGYPSDQTRGETWAIKLDVSAADTTGTATWGVDAGATTTRTGRYDPAWYADAGLPDAGELAANQQRIVDAPDNQWLAIAAPNRPSTNHDWGTAAIDGEQHQLLRWSGGHSAWSGTDVLHYRLADNRFAIGYRPELVFERTFTNDQMPGHWSPRGRPWMGVHTYKMYTYSSALHRMVIYKNPYTYFYDSSPGVMEFDLARIKQDLGGSQYVNTLTETPTGLIAWTPQGLFTLESRSGPWVQLKPTAIAGAQLPEQSPDRQTAVYDPTGNRLLCFATTGTAKGEVYAYSFADNTLRALNPVGKAQVAASMQEFVRESALLPSLGLVMFAIDFQTPADVTAKVKRVPVYDVANNRWSAWKLSDQAYGNSFAVVADATNQRIWGLGQRNEVFVLKLNPATADIEPLN